MADNENWRRQRAEELGLIDDSPWLGARSRPVARPASVHISEPAAPPPVAKQVRPLVVLKPWMAVAVLGALLAAAALGWVLRGAGGLPMTEISHVERAVKAPVAPPPAAVMPPAASIEQAPAVEPALPPGSAATTVSPPLPPVTSLPLASDRSAAGPSFNCARATTAVGRMICADPELAVLDREMLARYRARVDRSDLATERRLDNAQSAFLNARSRCSERACVDRLSRMRIAALE